GGRVGGCGGGVAGADTGPAGAKKNGPGTPPKKGRNGPRGGARPPKKRGGGRPRRPPRHNKLSAAINAPRTTNAVQAAAFSPLESVSTRNLTPYCVQTEQTTAASTAVRIVACEIGRRRM